MKKLLSFLLTLILLVSIATVSCFAYSVPSTAIYCTIAKNQAYSYTSDFVVGTYKIFAAKNDSASSHKLTVAAEFFDGCSDKYKTDTYKYVNAGSELTETETVRHSGPLCWRLYLKPYGLSSSGCSGEGYIRNK